VASLWEALASAWSSKLLLMGRLPLCRGGSKERAKRISFENARILERLYRSCGRLIHSITSIKSMSSADTLSENL
jgi:hypothetical protein